MIQLDIIREAAPDVAEAMLNELLRQRRNIELIASENFVSPAAILRINMPKGILTSVTTAAANMWT